MLYHSLVFEECKFAVLALHALHLWFGQAGLERVQEVSECHKWHVILVSENPKLAQALLPLVDGF